MRFSNTSPRKLSAAAATLALLSGGIAFAAPSSAAPAAAAPAKAAAGPEQCTQNDRVMDLPGDKPDTWVHVDTCVKLHDLAQAPAWVSGRSAVNWQILVDQVIDRSKRFTSFKVTTRLESRPSATGADTVQSTRTCDFTANLNADWAHSTSLNCHAIPVDNPVDTILWWSTDSTVVYDLEGDTQGPITWELTGSPQQV
ncbi:hypothetical protein [Streptomyces jumonjinensis]|uniref:Secreted protein n=1 Tax=Streptomyces jumonjinensis TaxID=1945 RepID=A0A646KNE5_STRJU|nr:hypothetical protein [Streptomyces jumonjinensis]MQT03765.1 hypothetical protein [Streptomyces jumonjinensis]